MGISYLPLSWNKYHLLSFKLATKLLDQKIHFQEIVAISRGGLTLGHMLSDLLNIPISTFTIQSYTGIQTQGELKITNKLNKSIRGKTVLLVDDVADSGKTLIRAKKYLRTFKPLSVTSATLFYKPHSLYKPDFYIETTSKWILFPYEPREMIATIYQNLIKEHKSPDQINQFLKNLNYTEAQINYVRQYFLKNEVVSFVPFSGQAEKGTL